MTIIDQPKMPYRSSKLAKEHPGKTLARIEEDKHDAAVRDNGGRPPHCPTKETQGLVTVLAGMGQSEAVIARAMKLDIDTFKKYYSFEFETGKTTLDGQAMMALFLNIQKGKEKSILFYLMTRVDGFMPAAESLINTQPTKTLEATPDNLAAAEALFESVRKL